MQQFINERIKNGIPSEVRVLHESDSGQTHDRYIIDDFAAYNTPPLNIIRSYALVRVKVGFDR